MDPYKVSNNKNINGKEFRLAKTIDEIYKEVKSYDMVITNDESLATAINVRIDYPIIGMLAITPRQMALNIYTNMFGDKEIYDELRIISTVSEDTKLDFRLVCDDVENIRDIRKHTREVMKYISTPSSHAIYASLKSLTTIERIMDEFDATKSHLFDNKRVAIIGLDFFDDLDKHFVPIDHKEISIFKETGSYKISTIYEIGDDRQIAENSIDIIDVNKQIDYAIVINPSSPIMDAIRVALYRRNIPFIDTSNKRNLICLRDYVHFIDLSFSYWTLRIKHVKSLFSNYGGLFKQSKEELSLSKQSNMNKRAEDLRALMSDIHKLTFLSVDDILYTEDIKSNLQIKMVLEDLRISNCKIEPQLVSKIIYAIDHVPSSRYNNEISNYKKEGVLIVDCHKYMFIDRPVAIYLGMGQDWDIPIPKKQYIDIESEIDKDVSRMEILVQQGYSRIYCVNNIENGKPVRPCVYFDQIIGKRIETFHDISDYIICGKWYVDYDPSLPKKDGVVSDLTKKFFEPFSKSSFNAYFSCPRAYMYNFLLRSPDNKSLKFGSIIHEFAEFYICYSKIVSIIGIDTFVRIAYSRYSESSSQIINNLDINHIRVAMVNIMRFIDNLKIQSPKLDIVNSSKPHPNFFMTTLGLKMASSICETRFRSSIYPIYGDFDLFFDGNVIDFKTGTHLSGFDICRSMDLGSRPQYPEFQPLIYIALQKEFGGRGEFDLFFVLDDNEKSSVYGSDINKNVCKVMLKNNDVSMCIKNSNELKNSLELELSKTFRKNIDVLINAILNSASTESCKLIDNENTIDHVIKAIKISNTKSHRKQAYSAVKKVLKHIYGGMIFTNSTVEIPYNIFYEFLNTLKRMHKDAMDGSITNLPARPRIKCRECKFFVVCTSAFNIVDD